MTLKRICSLLLLLFFSVTTPKVFALDKPDCLKTLSMASRFEDSRIGEGGEPSKMYKAYQEAFNKSDKISKADFVWLLQNGTPAGKIYAAMLLKGTGKASDAESFGKLVNDKSEVSLMSGCEIVMERVNSVAQSFIKSGECLGIKMLTKKAAGK